MFLAIDLVDYVLSIDGLEFYDVNGSSLTRIPSRDLDRFKYVLLYSKFQSVYVVFKCGGNTDVELNIEYSSLQPGKITGGN